MGSNTPAYSPNHIVDPTTGFLENPAFSNQFSAQKKLAFLKIFYENGLRIRRTCDSLGISIDTVNRHYQVDPKFREAYKELEAKYLDELEGVSRLNALNPRSVIERIFQLKCLLPEKYGQENRPVKIDVSISVDSQVLSEIKNRTKVIDIEENSENEPLKSVDNQSPDGAIQPVE